MSDPQYVTEVPKDEHEDSTLPATKRVLLYGWDSDTLAKVRLAVDPSGTLKGAVQNQLVPETYDSIEVNYTDSTKETISTVVFKLAGDTVATLTQTVASTKNTWAKT